MCIPPCDSSPLYLGCSSASRSRQELRQGLSFGEGRRSKRGATTMRKIQWCDLLRELGRLTLRPGVVGTHKDDAIADRRVIIQPELVPRRRIGLFEVQLAFDLEGLRGNFGRIGH